MLLLGGIVIVNRPGANGGSTSSKGDGKTEIRTQFQSKSTLPFFSISTQEYTFCENCPLYSSNWADSDQEGIFKDYLIRFSGWWVRPGTRAEDLGYTFSKDSYQSNSNERISDLEREKLFMKKLHDKVDVPIPFRIDLHSESIMIPVSKRTMDITYYVHGILMVLFICYFLMFVIGDFIKFLIDVAKGNTFTVENVKRLRFITLNLFIIPYGLFLINLSIPFIFRKYFTDDIVLNPSQWLNLGLPTILTLIFAAIYTAFKKGKQLSDEVELTI